MVRLLAAVLVALVCVVVLPSDANAAYSACLNYSSSGGSFGLYDSFCIKYRDQVCIPSGGTWITPNTYTANSPAYCSCPAGYTITQTLSSVGEMIGYRCVAPNCLSGEELVNGSCVAVCSVDQARDADGVCQWNACPTGQARDTSGVCVADDSTGSDTGGDTGGDTGDTGAGTDLPPLAGAVCWGSVVAVDLYQCAHCDETTGELLGSKLTALSNTDLYRKTVGWFLIGDYGYNDCFALDVPFIGDTQFCPSITLLDSMRGVLLIMASMAAVTVIFRGVF